MKTKWIEVMIIVMALGLLSLCFAAWDVDKPADSDAFYTWPTSIRANWDALEAVFGVDLVNASPWFDVRVYGAGTGESASTNATAIQAAIDAAEAVDGTVFFPPGTYETDTELDAIGPLNIWGPGVIIKQADGANLDYVLRVTPGSTHFINIRIGVDGNRDNNTAVEGIILKHIALSQHDINVYATECDTGIVIEGNCESSIFFTTTDNCGVGVLERVSGAYTPDEITIFVSGHTNGTHYKKESAGTQLTSIVHFSCETSSAYAAIIDGGFTVINGELRGCASGGINLISGGALFNGITLYGQDVEWALRVEDTDSIQGTFRSVNFDGGIWIKKCNFGSLYVVIKSTDSLPAIKLGDLDVGNTQAKRFTILPGSYAFSLSGPVVDFDKSYSCDVNLNLLSSTGTFVLFGEASIQDILRIPVELNDIATSVHASATNPAIEFYGYGTPPSFANVDATPSILMGNYFLSGMAEETITDFTDKAAGKEFTVISKAAITFDTTGTNLVGSSADIVTESGDITRWICEDNTTVRLLGFVDVSVDNSGGA